MLKIGLTGGIGSGKSAASDCFAQLGVPVVDADLVAREVVAPNTPALAAIQRRFGDTLLLPGGELDRRQLREIVFTDPAQRQWLEQLLHPLIRTCIIERLQQPSPCGYTLLVSPLLLETDQYQLVDAIVVVDVPEALQLQRACARDDQTAAQVERILAAQLPRQTRLARADHILDNSGDLNALRGEVQRLHRQFSQPQTATSMECT